MIDFNEVFDNYFARKQKPRPLGTYYPSEISDCLRKTWYTRKYPKEISKDLLKIFEAGNTLHDLVTKIIKSSKNPHIELLETELPFKQYESEFTISGRIDNLILLKENNEKVILEVKSTKFLPKEASQSHIDQLQLYMHNLNINLGTILYVQKDNFQTKSFNIEYDKEKSEEIIKRFHGLHFSLMNDVLPPAEAKQVKAKTWMCNYCPYKEECDAQEIE